MPDVNQLARDIAALQQQLAQRSRSLEEAEARYDAVFNSALSLMSICTTEGVILEVNRAAMQAIGLPIEEFVGRHVWESPWFAANPLEAAKIETAIRRQHGQYVEYESSVLFRSGEWRTCQFILRPYRSYLGADARFLVLEVRELVSEREKSVPRRDLDEPGMVSSAMPRFEAQD